jgi:hypothetical protein
VRLPSVDWVLKKCQPLPDGTWSGYLQPADIVALSEAGIGGFDLRSVSEAKKHVAKGTGSGRWCYFHRKS